MERADAGVRFTNSAAIIQRILSSGGQQSGRWYPCRLSGKQRQMARANRQRKRAVSVPLRRFAMASTALSTMTQGRAAQLGRKGGANNRKVYEGNQQQITPPQNARDVKNLLAETMAEIRAGKMDPRLGTTLGYLGTSLLKEIETSDIEERLEKLENGHKNPTQEA